MVPTDGPLERVFARWARRIRAPGIAWGLVRGGELVAAGGVGTLEVGAEARPGPDSVFRIASMTKSFTAAALMTLVVEGRLRLDDPVAAHVPELAGWRGPTADGPALTVRHLVSMEAGLPTDDPWADRHIDLTDAEMDALIERGGEFAWAPGTRFEYSNLGWGLVGRVIERVAGVRPQALVTSALLEPLGLSSTIWTRPAGRAVAEPYRVLDGSWVHEGAPLGDGTIAPMGGIWSTVADLARWVGFFSDAFPPRDDPDDGLLPRWARREMQQLRRVDEVSRFRPSPAGPSRVGVTGYGIGLTIRIDERLGASVGHSGGFPGYGSHMRWLPEHGIGIVALSNVTYAPMAAACFEALEVLADEDRLGPARPIAPAPALVQAAERSAALLTRWSDAEADSLFADNVGPDEAYERRSSQAEDIVARLGPVRVEALEPETPLQGAFTSVDGAVRVELGLHHRLAVQWLDVEDRTSPSDAPLIVDDERLQELDGRAFLVVRPTGDLSDAFDRCQGELLDRLQGSTVTVPAAHATLASFGSRGAPLAPGMHERLVAPLARWAAGTGPIELLALGQSVLEPGVPVLELQTTESFRAALASVRAAARSDGLPGGAGDDIAIEEWRPHLSLAYGAPPNPPGHNVFEAWAMVAGGTEASCTAHVAELVVFEAGEERRAATFRFPGAPEPR